MVVEVEREVREAEDHKVEQVAKVRFTIFVLEHLASLSMRGLVVLQVLGGGSRGGGGAATSTSKHISHMHVSTFHTCSFSPATYSQEFVQVMATVPHSGVCGIVCGAKMIISWA